MSIDYAVLKTELQNDRSGLGYSGRIFAGDVAGIADRMNLATSGLSGLVTQMIFRNDIRVGEVAQGIASGDFQSLQQIQILKLNLLFAGNATLDATAGVQYRFNFNSVFSGMPATQSGLFALSQRVGSRGEVLFGNGIVLTANDISQGLK